MTEMRTKRWIDFVPKFIDVYRHTKHPSINCPPYDAFYGRTDILLDQEEAPSFDEHRQLVRDTTRFWLNKTADEMVSRAQKIVGGWEPAVGDVVWLLKTLQKSAIRSKAEKLSPKYLETKYRIIGVNERKRFQLESLDGSPLPYKKNEFSRGHIACYKTKGKNSTTETNIVEEIESGSDENLEDRSVSPRSARKIDQRL